jgi:hypothetical protein
MIGIGKVSRKCWMAAAVAVLQATTMAFTGTLIRNLEIICDRMRV